MAAPKRKPKAKPAPEPELVIDDITQAPDPPAPAPAKRKRVRKPKEPTPAEIRKEKDRKQRELLWRLIIAKKKKLAALKFLAEYQKRNRLEYFNGPNALVNGKYLRANPKQQLILDAWNRPELKTFVYTGGNRCLGGETLIYDPIVGTSTPVSGIRDNFHVLAWDGEKLVPAFAFKPFAKDAEALYKVSLSDGSHFVASAAHQVLTPSGFCSVSELHAGRCVSSPGHAVEFYRSARTSNVPRWIGTVPSSQSGCPAYYGFCGAQLLQGSEIAPSVVPSRECARARTGSPLALGDGWVGKLQRTRTKCGGLLATSDGQLLYEPESGSPDVCTHCGLIETQPPVASQPIVGSCPPVQSTPGFDPQAIFCEMGTGCHVSYTMPTRYARGNLIALPPRVQSSHLSRSIAVSFQPATADVSPVPPNDVVYVTDVSFERIDVKWDLHVPLYNNYFCGGAIHSNSGKTTIGVVVALSVMFGQWLWNKQPIQFPHKEPRKVRVVTQDWEAGALRVLVPEIKKWWPEIRPHTTRKNNMGVESWWTDKITGSTLEIFTGNQDVMLHEGSHCDMVWFDEPISRAHYIANARGLVDRQGRELFTMTLLEQPWIDREIVRKTLKDADGRDTGKPDPSVFVVETMTTDNVGYGLTQRGLDDFAAKLTDEELEVRIKGVPRYKKGLVYPMFNRQIHVRERFRVPLDWPVDIAIDTHPRKPHSVLFMATNPRGLKYAVAEIRMHGNGTQLADEIVRMVQWGVYRVNRVVIDPLSKGDDNDPTGSTYAKVRDVLGRYDMVLETASKNKDTGILMVKEHLMGPNQEPSLFFFDDLIYTIRELESLSWEKPVDEDREKASKEGDDMCENLYRLILLETEYVPIEDGYEEEQPGVSSINEVTGY